VKEEFFTYLKSLNYENLSFKEVLADASSRRYYRFYHKKGSLILMQRASFDINTDRFYLTYNFFKKLKVNLPKLYYYDAKKGYMVLEDLGDLTIQSLNINKETNYLSSVNLITQYQNNQNINVYPMTYSFTYAKFYNELIMTKYYYIDKYKANITHNKKQLEFFFKELTTLIMQQKFCLTHRDYHSRNILVYNNKIYLIDFQDARLGPYTYDLASLIIDPYANIEDKLSNYLIETYYNNTKHEAYKNYILNYNLTCLQRALKILGSYAYQKIVNNNDTYLKYIPITIEKIKNIKKTFPKWETLIQEVFIN